MIDTFWFWLLIIGIFLVILAGLLSGCMNETHGWMWGLFVVGVIFILIALVIALIGFVKNLKINVTETHVSPYYASSMNTNSLNRSSAYEPNLVTSGDNNKSVYASLPVSRTVSPMATPSRSVINIPQAQRGFTATNIQISSLSPDL